MAIRVRSLIVGLALSASAAVAGTAGPVLTVASTCASTMVAAGGTATVAIVLTPGATEITGLDFTLSFDPGSLAFQGVVLADAVAAPGGWDQPATAPVVTPGRVQVLMAPKLRVPLPAFPAGVVAVATFKATASASPRCESIGFTPGSVVFSAPPLGLAVPDGSTVDGGLLVTSGVTTTTTTTTLPRPVEACDDCRDNDGDDMVDLADPDCQPTALLVLKASVKKGRPQTSADDRVTVAASLGVPLGDVVDGVRIALGGTGTPAVCELIPASSFGTNRKRTSFIYKRGGAGLVLVRLKQKKGVTQVALTLKGQTLAGTDQKLAVSLGIGSGRYHGTATLRAQGKKLVFP